MKNHKLLQVSLMIGMMSLAVLCPLNASAQPDTFWPHWNLCQDGVFSTEEDFVSLTMAPCDENPYVSDGDLISVNSQGLCLRNADLLRRFEGDAILESGIDLGLDAVDILDFYQYVVAFSTEIDHPDGRFTAGDLLIVSDAPSEYPISGIIIPNAALLHAFRLKDAPNLGLDALHFVGDPSDIIRIVEYELPPEKWLDGELQRILDEDLKIDIWFSIEGTWPSPLNSSADPYILDGDLLSAKTGSIIHAQSDLLGFTGWADIRKNGIDFGLDAFAGSRDPNPEGTGAFSTEIQSSLGGKFTAGDIILFDGTIYKTNAQLIGVLFEGYVGLDALWLPD